MNRKLHFIYFCRSKSTIKKAIRLLMFLFLIVLVPAFSFAQSYYYNGGGTGVADITAWGTNTNGTGTNPANFSTAGSVFYFNGNNSTNTVNLPPTWSVTGTGSKVVITKGVNVITDTLGLAAATTFDVDSNSWLTIRDTINITLGSLNSLSTVVYDGKKSMNILPASYGNLSSTNDSAYKRKFAFGRMINIAGIFTTGKATYSDSSTITLNGVNPQKLPTHSYFNLVIANKVVDVDTISAPIIKSGGTLTVNAGDSINVNGNGVVYNAVLEYHSTKKPVLTGVLEIGTGATFALSNSLTAVPVGIMWDSAANLNLGYGSATMKTLPKLNLTDTFENIIINAPAVVLAKNAALLPNTAGSYNMNGDLTLIAGRVNHSGAGTAAKSLTVGGNLNILGGSYYISDSSKSKVADSLIVMGVTTVSGGQLFMTHDTAAAQIGKGVLVLYTDFFHTGGQFGNSPNSISGGKMVFATPDTAGQVIQTIGLTQSWTAPIRMEVTGGYEVEVQSSFPLYDTLFVTSGYFTVNVGYTMTMNKPVVVGYSRGNFVFTDGVQGYADSGRLIYNNVPKNTNVVVPIGGEGSFQPMYLKCADDSASYTLNTWNGITKNGNLLGDTIDVSQENDYIYLVWNINRNDKGTSPVQLTLQWDTGYVLPRAIANNYTNLSLYQGDGINNFKPIPSVIDTTKFTSTITWNNKNGKFMIAKNYVSLPVRFINVQANKVPGFVAISWSTGNEGNMQSYEIQRSSDGINFSSISSVTAENNLTGSYKFNDNNYLNGVAYYRIKGIANNGKIIYSSIVKVNSTKLETAINVFPNPVQNRTFNVSLNDLPADTYTIQVSNSIGQVLYNKQIVYTGGNNITTVQSNKLPYNAVCFVKVISKDQTYTTTVLVK